MNKKKILFKRIASALLAAVMIFCFAACEDGNKPVKECTEHTYGDFTVTKEATCTEDGTKERVCSVCGHSEIWYIQATGHDFSEWTMNKEGSCTEKGEEIRTCSKCGRVESRESAEAGHKFGNWKVVEEATGLKEGTKERKCTECGATETAKIAKLAELNAEQISTKCAGSVFFIRVYDRNGYALRTGSGFFINSNGMAVTNYHVITGAYSAKITLPDGTEKNVEGLYDGSEGDDTAIIKVEGSGYKPLTIGDSEAVVAGQKVFAIGSPLGLDNSISEGIISNTNRKMDNTEYIQITAPISPGSSGGALLDAFGNVIGITSAYVNGEAAQNLNLARRISLLNRLNKDDFIPLPEAFPPEPASIWVGVDELHVVIGSNPRIWVYRDYVAGSFISCYMSNENICQGKWDDQWDGDWIGLTIIGKTAGQATLTLKLKDDKDTVYDTHEIQVEVLDKTPNYDNTSVPDFGVIANLPELFFTTEENMVIHYYPIEGWYMDNLMDLYSTIMEKAGYKYSQEYDDELGPIYSFVSNDTGVIGQYTNDFEYFTITVY